MASILKGIRTTVKIVAAIISIAFLLNSVNGALTAMSLADGESIKLSPIDPGDFKIDFNDLNIEVGINITNPGIYDLTDIVVGMKFEVKPNITGIWKTVLDNNSVALGQADGPTGDLIKAGETKEIGLNATMASFALTPEEIASYFSLEANWTLADLMEAQEAGVSYDARLTLTFDVAYAFKQYDVAVTIVLDNAAVQGGLV